MRTAAVVAVLLSSHLAVAGAPIIGGTSDTSDPAVVMIAAYPSDMATLFTCTAVVVSPTALITAAHCVDHPGYSFGVYYGADASAYTTLALLAPHLSPVSAVHMDPAYQVASPFFGDIAVVDLASPTTITPLVFSRTAPDASLVDMSVRIIGYGQIVYNTPNQVRYAATTIVDAIDPVDTILVGDTTHNTLTCVGDSGAPALLNNIVLGVDSYSDTTGCTDPAHFRRTDLYADFIDQYAGTTPPPSPMADAGVAADALISTEPSKGGGCSTGAGAGPAAALLVLASLVQRNRRDRRGFAV